VLPKQISSPRVSRSVPLRAFGDVATYYDFSSTNNGVEGQIQSYTTAGGTTINFTYDSNGNLTAATRSYTSGTVTTQEAYLYTYLPSTDANAGLLSNVTLARKTWDTSLHETEAGTPYSTVQQVSYTYYDGVTNAANGNLHDLQTATVQDPSGNVLSVDYYRYYTGDTYSGSTYIGYANALKFVVNGAAYARLAASLPSRTTPLTATDAQVATCADNYFQYNSSRQVTMEVAQGSGCSCPSVGGEGTYTYSYATNSSSSDDYDQWKTKTVETLPNGDTETFYCDYAGLVMLQVYTNAASGQRWGWYSQYNSQGEQTLYAQPSAVVLAGDSSAIEANNALVNDTGEGAAYLNNTGLIQLSQYYSSTTATSTTAGGVAGYLSEQEIQQGQSGTPIPQLSVDYFADSAGGTGTATVYPTADETVYSGTGGSGAETTSYSYTFYSGTVAPESITTTAPTVSSAENGPGTPDVSTQVFDLFGNNTWTMDGDGFIDYAAYDPITGAVTKQITDVDTARTSDFANLPATWVTPSGGGLELTTTYAVDALGRDTEIVSPGGNVTYIVYNDPDHEGRTYQGWNATTGTTTGPIEISDEYWPAPNSGGAVYDETLTSSATPTVSGSAGSYVPTGAETIDSANIQSLDRDITDAGGQTIEDDAYVSLAGVTYSQTSTYLGSSGTNFNATIYGYNQMGLQDKTIDPNGTITREVINGLGEVTSLWTGTDDNGATWTDPTGGGASGNNMTEVSADLYDQWPSTLAAPATPSLSLATGGSSPDTTYYVTVTYVDSHGESLASSESSLLVPSGDLLTVASPAAEGDATNYNIYVGTASGSGVLQNSTPVSLGTSFTLPDGALAAGPIAPVNGVGDGNLTEVEDFPGGAAAPQVTLNSFDWRDRAVESKSGVILNSNGTDDTAAETANPINRPITYTSYDNLNDVTATQMYEGDGIAVTTTDGVPDAPSSSLLRAQTTNSWDAQGREYQTTTYSVDPSSGAVSMYGLTTNYYYDHRGDLIETANPGGEVDKSAFDGAGRDIADYVTDGAGGTSWADASTVTGDHVLNQVFTTYDSDSNPILAVNYDRFSNATSTGVLASSDSRLTYVADYYDAADRLTATEDVGTNGGSAWTRPTTPDASDATHLVTTYDYDSAGNQNLTIDPRGVQTLNSFDMLGQTIKTIAAWDGSPSATPTDVTV